MPFGASIPHILVVDDEAAMRAVLRDGFVQEGYIVDEARDRDELLRRLDQKPVSLITLDLGLAGDDGLDLAREIRSRHNVPIVMITGRGDPFDRVVGLENGADDYIVKPFHIGEVLVRIGHVLRRYELEVRHDERWLAGRRFAIEGHVVDTARRELRRTDGSLVDLTEMEFRLLELFIEHAERVLSRDEITRALKGHEWSPENRTIDGHIARLRRKIEPDCETPQLIKSVRGVGYIFAGEVKRL
jgi:DNA-binding response OmpR family regulator